MAEVRRPTLFLLISITMVGQMAMNITLPSLSFIAQDFGTTEAIAQLNLSLYLVGTAIAQLIFGPLSDRYGRRVIVLIGNICSWLCHVPGCAEYRGLYRRACGAICWRLRRHRHGQGDGS